MKSTIVRSTSGFHVRNANILINQHGVYIITKCFGRCRHKNDDYHPIIKVIYRVFELNLIDFNVNIYSNWIGISVNGFVKHNHYSFKGVKVRREERVTWNRTIRAAY